MVDWLLVLSWSTAESVSSLLTHFLLMKHKTAAKKINIYNHQVCSSALPSRDIKQYERYGHLCSREDLKAAVGCIVGSVGSCISGAKLKQHKSREETVRAQSYEIFYTLLK